MCNLLFLCDYAHTKTMTITVFFYERQWRMQELTNGGGGGGAPILSRIYTFWDPESTHPSRIYPLLHHYMRHSYSRPLPPSIKHPYATLPESTSDPKHPFLNIHMRPSLNLPLPPRIYPPLNIHMRWWVTPESKPSWPKIKSPS